jgi:hypothetical protein
MTRRPKAATVDIGLRVKEPMRARIEKGAKKRGVSMNAEIADRLETSFTKEDMLDRFFGGPEMRRMAILWAAAFMQGAGPSHKNEFTDPTTTAYLGGAFALIQSLMMGMPTDRQAALVDALKSPTKSIGFWVPLTEGKK